MKVCKISPNGAERFKEKGNKKADARNRAILESFRQFDIEIRAKVRVLEMSGFDVSKILESHCFKRNRAALTSFAYALPPNALTRAPRGRHECTRTGAVFKRARRKSSAVRKKPPSSSRGSVGVKTTWFKFRFIYCKNSSIHFASFRRFMSPSCSEGKSDYQFPV